ncbi:UDP-GLYCOSYLTRANSFERASE 82A1 [Salix purpurea]|uniref:Glycosyltransferase n=1 Tax=Salix purpurea TaxID=77065 RepID=A0A9Q0T3R6_SALPP|nr:UDP-GLYCOSYLTRANSFERASE 82A1 [Salix purpurea]
MKWMRKPKIILVPYPAQGHVTPILNLASTFLSHGFEPVMVTPEFIHRRFISNIDSKSDISCISIPDGLEMDKPSDFFAIEKAMENTMPTHLESLVQKLSEDGEVVACMVVDLLASWAIGVGHRCGVPVAGFWPAMLATYQLIAAIPDMVGTQLISDTGTPQHPGPLRFLPDQPLLSTEDLPWLIGTPPSRKARFKFWTRALDRSRNLPWLLVNSFPDEFINHDKPQNGALLENSMNQPRIFQVGSLSKHALVKNPSFWEEDLSCLQWLDKQKLNSVLYISFGSWVSPIGEGNVKKLALTLEEIGLPFLWVLGPTWKDGLPSGYLERVSKQGTVVSWAPQHEVLQHEAVTCYLTHCGWNSTMEAIRCQKRLLCYPVAGDQFVNCAYITEKWKIGVRISGLGQKEMERGLRRVMDDKKMSDRLGRLRERTMGEEASSVMMSSLATFVNDFKKQTDGMFPTDLA